MDNSRFHQAIVSFFLDHQRAPKVPELAELFGCSEQQARDALRSLADYHGVVLHPKSEEVWVVHPFSTVPSTFVVRAGARSWWGNCAWCSLGLAHLLGGTATIETRVGASEEFVELHIENGTLTDKDFVVHFPVPMRRAWDNVIYTCSVMLLFRDESQVDAWCDVRGIPKGDVRPIEQVSRFAAEWYGRHTDADWTKLSSREASAMFERHGLTGPIWELPMEDGRF